MVISIQDNILMVNDKDRDRILALIRNRGIKGIGKIIRKMEEVIYTFIF